MRYVLKIEYRDLLSVLKLVPNKVTLFDNTSGDDTSGKTSSMSGLFIGSGLILVKYSKVQLRQPYVDDRSVMSLSLKVVKFLASNLNSVFFTDGLEVGPSSFVHFQVYQQTLVLRQH